MVTWWVSTSCQVGCSPRRVVFPRPAVGPHGAEPRSRRDVPARRDSILRKAWGFLEVWHPICGSTCSTCGSGPTRLVIKPTALKKWLIVPPGTGSFHETYRKWIRVEVPLCEIRRTKSGCVSISCLRVTFAYALPIVTPGFSEGNFFLAHWAHCSGLSTPS